MTKCNNMSWAWLGRSQGLMLVPKKSTSFSCSGAFLWRSISGLGLFFGGEKRRLSSSSLAALKATTSAPPSAVAAVICRGIRNTVQDWANIVYAVVDGCFMLWWQVAGILQSAPFSGRRASVLSTGPLRRLTGSPSWRVSNSKETSLLGWLFRDLIFFWMLLSFRLFILWNSIIYLGGNYDNATAWFIRNRSNSGLSEITNIWYKHI